MSFLVDTDTCSAHLKNVRVVNNRFLQYGGLHISVVTMAELEVWLRRRKTPRKRWKSYQDMVNSVSVLDVDQTTGQRAGEIGADLSNKGLPTEISDLLIAATALIHNLTLVTHNTRDFANVPGLAVVDWLVP